MAGDPRSAGSVAYAVRDYLFTRPSGLCRAQQNRAPCGINCFRGGDRWLRSFGVERPLTSRGFPAADQVRTALPGGVVVDVHVAVSARRACPGARCRNAFAVSYLIP